MADYKVKEVLNEGKSTGTYEWNGDTYWTFKVSIEDGTVCEVSRKSDTPPDVGQEYEVFEHKNTDYPPKLKKPISNFKGGGKSGGGKGWDAPERLRGENYRSALHVAKDLYMHTFPSPTSEPVENVLDWTERFYLAIEATAQVGPSVGTSPAVSTGAENGRSEGSSSSGTGGEPSGAPSAIDLLKARLEYKVDPDVFSMLVTSVGAESVQGATEEQRAEIMAQLAGLAA